MPSEASEVLLADSRAEGLSSVEDGRGGAPAGLLRRLREKQEAYSQVAGRWRFFARGLLLAQVALVWAGLLIDAGVLAGWIAPGRALGLGLLSVLMWSLALLAAEHCLRPGAQAALYGATARLLGEEFDHLARDTASSPEELAKRGEIALRLAGLVTERPSEVVVVRVDSD
jgi:hypothetical protein